MRHLFSKSWIGFFLFFPSLVWAAGSGNPFMGVFFQAFNFILFVVLLIFFVRKPLQVFYKSRRENFLQFENMARQKEEKIQEEYKEWKEKLKKMEARDQNGFGKSTSGGGKVSGQKNSGIAGTQSEKTERG